MTTEQPRPQTPIDRMAEAHLDAEVELSPLTATYLGLPGHESEIDDLSPDGLAAASRLRRRTLAALDEAAPVDDVMQAPLLSTYLGHPIDMIEHDGRRIFIPKEDSA